MAQGLKAKVRGRARSDEGTAHEDNAEPCQQCQRCDEERDHVTAGKPSWEHIRVLESPIEHESFPDIVTTEDQHIGDMDGVLARYEFPSSVRCSLKGRHWHRRGVVVKALCGKVLSMGFDCGEKSIIGFKAIRRSVAARVRFQEQAEYLEGFSREFGQRINRVRPHLRSRNDAITSLAGKLPDLYRVLTQRHQEAGTGREVLVGDQRFEIRGLALFKPSPPNPGDLSRRLESFNQAYRESPPVDGPSAASLARKALGVAKAVDKAEAWLRDTEPFLTEANLQLCLGLVDGGSLRVERRDGRFVFVGRGGPVVELTTWPSLQDLRRGIGGLTE